MRAYRSLAAPVALLAAITLAGCGSAAKDDKADAKSTPTLSKSAEPEHVITTVFDDPADDTEAQSKEILELSGTKGIADGFSTNFVLPEDLTIHAASGDDSPYYDPTTKTVNLSYGFVDTTKQIIQASQPDITDNELGKQWASVNDFILIHEMAHAFVDVLEIPVTGREEDAADGMATYFFTDAVPGGAEYAFAAATFFSALQSVQGEPDATQFADEHSLSIQRAGDIACKVAGSSDENMQIVSEIGGDLLTAARLERCPAEYQQMSKAWSALLKPHLRES